jgi:5-formyltetrahydrofolate cyclo-ligase
MDKALLRRKMIQWRMAQAPGERKRLSRKAQEALIASDWFRQAKTVLIYIPFRGEVNTDMITVAAVAAKKRLVLPRIEREPKSLVLHRYTGDQTTLIRGPLGIREPGVDWPIVPAGEIDLVITPGVAFDRQGNRLGYGGGYYDRMLPEIKRANSVVMLIGLAFRFQVIDVLPTEPHDIPMHGVATDEGLLR